MNTFEFFFIFLSNFQFLYLIYLLFLSIKRVSFLDNFFNLFFISNKNNTNTRLYECATVSRKNNLFTYSVNFLSLIISYLVYDVDLLFFFSEVTIVSSLSLDEFLYFFLFIYFFIIGLFFDLKKENIGVSSSIK